MKGYYKNIKETSIYENCDVIFLFKFRKIMKFKPKNIILTQDSYGFYKPHYSVCYRSIFGIEINITKPYYNHEFYDYYFDDNGNVYTIQQLDNSNGTTNIYWIYLGTFPKI